ncbi:Flp pilus assembly protein CpaB [Brevundimonas sp.]|jgi:pilus assembly protein CpaB|uniref:Flp pilus assembly protein CpaB n=1 Tax=Brevundimonas sp. TaxID=1871086 RepID=UPI0037BFAD7E
MKPARIAVICIAAVSALGLALVVRAMGNGSEPAAPAAAAPVETRPMAKVLVAAKDLEPGARLTEADLAWKDWPVDQVNPVFITDGATPIPPKPAPTTASEKAEGAVERVAQAATQLAGPGAKSDYLGSVVREPILAGEPIVARKIVRAGDSGYLAAYLEPGMRAMAIAVTVESAAGGFILPGDRVDVVLTTQNEANAAGVDGGASARAKFSSATVMQNVKVLAIDQSTRAADEEQAVVGATATLEVRPQDAVVLAQAKSEGELSLSLRSYADTAGPSGAARSPRGQPHSVRVYRGGDPEVVVTP